MMTTSCLMDMESPDLPNYPGSVACSVLDAIEAAGPGGADVDTLVGHTSCGDIVLGQVLRDLRNHGLAWTTADLRYRLTNLGTIVRSLAPN
jgi:hypothetical protein